MINRYKPSAIFEYKVESFEKRRSQNFKSLAPILHSVRKKQTHTINELSQDTDDYK